MGNYILSCEGVGLGCAGFRLVPKAVRHGLCDRTSLAQLGSNLWLSGLKATQTADDPQTSPRHW